MIIYIHGFGSHGYGSKAKVFREYFTSIEEDFIAPSLSYVPQLAIQTLEELIKSYHGEVYLIGSSLGGFYATYLSQMPQVKKFVLINPATKPMQTLSRALGDAPNFYDDSYYSWSEKHLAMLEHYRCEDGLSLSKLMLMVQKGDELLNYSDAVKKYDGAKQIVEEKGNHSFEGIERHFETIREFFAVGNHFKHTSHVKGVGFSNKELAERVGNLYYDDMAEFLEALSKKITLDSKADRERGRVKLANALDDGAKHLQKSGDSIKEAWSICKNPTLKWMLQNGFNKEISLGILESMIFYEFGNRSRWDNVSMTDETTRHNIANYDDDFTWELLAPFSNKGRAYIEFLKTYLKVIADGDFYPEDIPNKHEFIKEKCEKFGFVSSFKRYYKR